MAGRQAAAILSKRTVPVKNILFVTSNSLATNPRLVKELRACTDAGHRATVISFSFQNWSKPLNDRLHKELGDRVNFVLLPGDRTGKGRWLASTIINRISRIAVRLLPDHLFLSSLSFSKRSWLLSTALKQQTGSFDFVISHNPGAFAPAYFFSKARNVPLGVDLEDFHPGESNHLAATKTIGGVMKKILPSSAVITASSPLILKESEPYMRGSSAKHAIIRNVFSLQLQPSFKELSLQPLKLIWFSQIVGMNRGIQDAILAMNRITSCSIQLSILGHCCEDTKAQLSRLLTEQKHQLLFLDPKHEDQLIEACSHHHIGLALEPGFSRNNQLALSNKLFTYLLAGNAIIASETEAQKTFFEQYPGVGTTYPIGDIITMAGILSHFASQLLILQETRRKAYRLAQTQLNWETESQRFLNIYRLSN
jgi:glycosyltransferase involved in cell wall biosynthesis